MYFCRFCVAFIDVCEHAHHTFSYHAKQSSYTSSVPRNQIHLVTLSSQIYCKIGSSYHTLPAHASSQQVALGRNLVGARNMADARNVAGARKVTWRPYKIASTLQNSCSVMDLARQRNSLFCLFVTTWLFAFRARRRQKTTSLSSTPQLSASC